MIERELFARLKIELAIFQKEFHCQLPGTGFTDNRGWGKFPDLREPELELGAEKPLLAWTELGKSYKPAVVPLILLSTQETDLAR